MDRFLSFGLRPRFLRYHWLQQQKYRKKGYQPNIYLREWAIKTELKYRARIYDPLEHEEEHKSIGKYEPPQQQQQREQPYRQQTTPKTTNGDGSSSSPAMNQDERDGRRVEQQQQQRRPNEKEEEEDARQGDENKSSLAHISNQMVMSIRIIPRERLCLNTFIYLSFLGVSAGPEDFSAQIPPEP